MRGKEVRYDIFCKSCEFSHKSASDAPCSECLGTPSNEESHKPVNYKQVRPIIFYFLPDQKDYTYDLKKAENWDQEPTDSELKKYFKKNEKGDWYEKGNKE